MSAASTAEADKLGTQTGQIWDFLDGLELGSK